MYTSIQSGIQSWSKAAALAGFAALAGVTFVYAQQPGAPDRPSQTRLERYRPTADDFGAFTDARVAAIKAGLRLTPDQEKNWPAFEEAFRTLSKLRTERILAFRDGPPASPSDDMLENLQRRAEVIGRSAAALKQVADATAPLYKSLDDAQKRRFAVLAPMLGQPPGPPPNFRRGGFPGRGPEDMNRGPGPDRQQRGMDRPRGGAMERIRFDSDIVEHEDTVGPGVGLARENGWR